MVRKLLSCVLMMILLCACGAGGSNSPEHLAAQIRAEYLTLSGWSSDVSLSADYGEQVFDFAVNASWQRDGDTVITVTEPKLIEGITARIRDGETLLEYDSMGFSLGMLDLSGLTPVSAIPALMDCIVTGYMARCSWQGEGESRELVILCRDPNAESQQGTEYTLIFDPVTHVPKRAEVTVDGVLRLTVRFTDFSMELTDDEAGTDENLGRN